jgi:hypothetical protein
LSILLLKYALADCFDQSVLLYTTKIEESQDMSSDSSWSDEFEEVTYGGPTEKWDLDLDSSDVFGVKLSGRRNSTGTATFSVDYISITIYYTRKLFTNSIIQLTI